MDCKRSATADLVTKNRNTMKIELVFTILCGFGASVFFYFFAKFRTEIFAAKNENNILRIEKEKIEERLNILQQKNLDLEKQNEALNQASQQVKIEKEQWQQDKEVALFKMSEELMKRNIEQQNKISLNQQENIKKITAELFKDFENVTAKITALNGDVKKSVDESNLLKNALLAPGSAGRTAEITLENILKNSGLKEKSNLNAVGDYILQSHFGGISAVGEQESKRPDVIVFFPNDQIAVVDSKSSPHFLELEQAKKNGDIEGEKIIRGKIKDSFRRHLESLKRKDYTKFLFEELRSKNRSDYKIIVIMFLQTEKMLEVICDNDEGFVQKALESGVLVLTPVGMINFLSQARFVIDRVKQEKNVEDLKIQLRKLLDNIAVIFKESKEMGKSLNKAMSSYSKMTKNLNRGVYSAVKNISDLGIEGKKSADLKMLEEYENGEEDAENDASS